MATREITCGDCSVIFTHERGGKGGLWPTYCQPCRAVRDRASNRRKSYAWRERNPAQWKAVQDRANAKKLADPEHRRRKREAEVTRNYGITPAELIALEAAQGGLCAVCQQPPRGKAPGRAHQGVRREAGLHVDHCHGSGRVRGLLCGNCNTMIGLAGEDPKVLMAAVEYLEKG